MTTLMQQTSLFAYFTEIQPQLGNRQKAVYEAIRTKKDFTNSELASYLGWGINTVTPRVMELRKAGLVKESCIRECAITGRNVIAWTKII